MGPGRRLVLLVFVRPLDQYSEHKFILRSLVFSPLLILLANSRRGSFVRDLGKLGYAGKASPGRQTPRAEFANRIHGYSRP
jgi:hypothetical protein